jgi:hypothetical protein
VADDSFGADEEEEEEEKGKDPFKYKGNMVIVLE